MITRLEVDGFKSLRDFAVDLDPFTVLIGPNGAGKSNVLEALALLSRLSSMSLDEAFKRGRGKAIDQFTRRGGAAGTTIRFAVEVFALRVPRASRGPNRFRYEVSVERRKLASGAERLAIAHERLAVPPRETDAWIASHPELAPLVEYEPGGRDVLKHERETSRQRVLTARLGDRETEEYRVPRTHTAIAAYRANLGEWRMVLDLDAEELAMLDELKRSLALPDDDAVFRHAIREKAKALGIDLSAARVDTEVDHVASELGSYRVIQLEPAYLRESSERLGSDVLAPDASNIPTVLANLPPEVLGAICADLVALVPGVASFEIVAEGDAFRIEFELSGGERMPARLMSDGTLRILALLTALEVEPRSSVIGVEEPENGVYPGGLRKLVEFLRESTASGEGHESRTQIILTSHSPVILAALRAHPTHLRLLDLLRRDGERISRARPVGRPAGLGGGRTVASLREIDEILHAVDSEDAR